MGFLSRLFGKNSDNKRNYDTKDRYLIEHNLLPSWFLGERGSSLADEILKKPGEFFVKLYNVVNQDKSHYHCPYSIEQFSAENLFFEDINGNNIHVIQISMPVPEKTPLCEKILLVYDDSFEKRRYITVEKDDMEGLFICEWEVTGTHVLYSKYSQANMLKVLGVK